MFSPQNFHADWFESSDNPHLIYDRKNNYNFGGVCPKSRKLQSKQSDIQSKNICVVRPASQRWYYIFFKCDGLPPIHTSRNLHVIQEAHIFLFSFSIYVALYFSNVPTKITMQSWNGSKWFNKWLPTSRLWVTSIGRYILNTFNHLNNEKPFDYVIRSGLIPLISSDTTSPVAFHKRRL